MKAIFLGKRALPARKSTPELTDPSQNLSLPKMFPKFLQNQKFHQ
jgi:hypothetical protein